MNPLLIENCLLNGAVNINQSLSERELKLCQDIRGRTLSRKSHLDIRLRRHIRMQRDCTDDNQHAASDYQQPMVAVCRRINAAALDDWYTIGCARCTFKGCAAQHSPPLSRPKSGESACRKTLSCTPAPALRSRVTITTTAGLRCGRTISKLAEGQMDQLVSYGGLPW